MDEAYYVVGDVSDIISITPNYWPVKEKSTNRTVFFAPSEQAAKDLCSLLNRERRLNMLKEKGVSGCQNLLL